MGIRRALALHAWGAGSGCGCAPSLLPRDRSGRCVATPRARMRVIRRAASDRCTPFDLMVRPRPLLRGARLLPAPRSAGFDISYQIPFIIWKP